jgi:hypothetical protein
MSAKGLMSSVRVLPEDSPETRIGLSGAARKAAEAFAKMPGSKVIKHAQAHRHVTASASVLHGWDAQQDNSANVIVNIALLDIPPSEISAE